MIDVRAARPWCAAAILLASAACTVTVPGQGRSAYPERPILPVDCNYTPVDSDQRPDLLDIGIPEDPDGSTEAVVLDAVSSRGDFEMTLDPIYGAVCDQ